MGFITEPYILKKIWTFFNLAFEPLAHLNSFCHVILCESLFDLDSVWVQLKVILQDSVNGSTGKTQLLRASLEWLFWTPPNRISHCVDILWGPYSQLSTTCWFLSFFGGLYQCSCVLELLYPASTLELMGKVIDIKPVVSRLDSLQWFCLQIEGHTKCFSTTDHIISLIKWNVILFSINPEKHRIISLILVELLAFKWSTLTIQKLTKVCYPWHIFIYF